MKVFIAIIALTLAVASQASYVPDVAPYTAWPVSTSVWPPNGIYAHGGYNAWPHTAVVNAWNAHPYANQWTSPAVSIYKNGLYGHKTVVQANLGKAAYPWGQPWGSYGAAWGYNGGYLPSYPVSKQIAATPGSYHVATVPVGAQKLIVA